MDIGQILQLILQSYGGGYPMQGLANQLSGFPGSFGAGMNHPTVHQWQPVPPSQPGMRHYQPVSPPPSQPAPYSWHPQQPPPQNPNMRQWSRV